MVLAAADRGASFGTPFPRGFEDFRDVEMWPLVQSFALEDSDQDRFDDEGGRFFTMQYKIKGAKDNQPHLQVVSSSVRYT